jgi:hypothetical protein
MSDQPVENNDNVNNEFFEMKVKRKGAQGVLNQTIICEVGSDSCKRITEQNGEKKEETITKKKFFGLDKE